MDIEGGLSQADTRLLIYSTRLLCDIQGGVALGHQGIAVTLEDACQFFYGWAGFVEPVGKCAR